MSSIEIRGSRWAPIKPNTLSTELVLVCLRSDIGKMRPKSGPVRAQSDRQVPEKLTKKRSFRAEI